MCYPSQRFRFQGNPVRNSQILGSPRKRPGIVEVENQEWNTSPSLPYPCRKL
ncbi:unnamed protein product [Timema podura]|uniref:Uncharacterized protein n=1 Tax=Timema podura TaxID=61482 RepID=A0ABN7PGY4_TIMPD|nr:unnamed protein product [Timema podura]